MNEFKWSDFDYSDTSIDDNRDISIPEFKKDTTSFSFSDYDYIEPSSNIQEEEGIIKSGLRTALQVPQGIAELTPPGILSGLWSLFAHGESELDPFEEARISEASIKAGKEFSPKQYEQSRQEALSILPTVSNIARGVEGKTGIPLEPKTRLQKGVRLASQVTKGTPSPSAAAPKGYTFRGLDTGLPKAVIGAGVAGTREALYQSGVPDPLAELVSLGIIKPTSGTSGQVIVAPVKKESGLTKRQFENIKKPTEISAKSFEKIREKTESEFRQITDKIIKDTPINETYASLRDNPQFKQNTREAFKDLDSVASNINEMVSTENVLKEVGSIVKSKPSRGFLPSEYEKNYNKFLNEMIKETPKKNLSAKDLLQQFRKDNEAYGQVKEPGQSYAYNQAKRDALRDYNVAIEKTIESNFSKSEFPKTFKELNDRWTKIMDAEVISEFLDDTFAGKIDFKNAKDLFDKNGMSKPFERAMGKEGFNQFKTLVNDLIGAEKSYKLLKVAKEKGYGDLVKTVGAYAVHPELAQAKLGFDVIKGGYKKIFDMLIDKPEIAITWDRGINALKSGNFKVAEKELLKVKAAEENLSKSEQTRREALKKFNLKKKKSIAENVN